LTSFAPALDVRTTLARPDLAEQALEGLVRAAAYRTVTPMRGAAPVADIHAEADTGSDRIDQLIFGEIFDVLDQRGDRVWGRARRDGTVGWMDVAALSAGARLPTHRVAAAKAALPLNALVRGETDGLSASSLKPGDLAPIGDFEIDPVAVAEQLLGVPHRLGARSSLATDCSGMVQQALYACGLAAPRHSDQQAQLGHAVEQAELQRGDLVVWLAPEGETGFSGHSALVLDAQTLIHATGHHGQVALEPLDEALARYAAAGFGPALFRRVLY